MPQQRTRTWVDGLENLGENLIRLATSLKTLEGAGEAASSDFGFAEAMAQLGETYGLAFGQAHPLLVSTEEAFVEMVAEDENPQWESEVSDDRSHQAAALVHEAILSSSEIVSLLARVAQAARVSASMTRQVLRPTLPAFTESASVVGWELKRICHEFQSEMKLLGHAPRSLADLGPGTRALALDMVEGANKLRVARREWFMIDHRLASATGAGVGGAPSPGRSTKAG